MIPYTIGITGHRKLNAFDGYQLHAHIRRLLANRKKEMPHTELIFISALAEGADRLGAGIALELGYSLWVVLPTAQDEYEKDFLSPDSTAEFREVLGKAQFVVNASVTAGREADAALRPQIYIDAGHEICRLSNCLIAVWDGQSSRGPGGTADVISMFREGRFPGATGSGVAFPDCGAVYHITPDAVVKILLPTLLEHQGSELLRQELHRGALNLDRLNAKGREAMSFADDGKSHLLPQHFNFNDSTIIGWNRVGAIADQLSSDAAKRREHSLLSMVVLFALFSSFSLLYGGLVVEVWPLVLGVASVTGAAVAYREYRRSGNDEIWVGMRGLCELFRVGITWRVCGVGGSMHHLIAEEQVSAVDALGISAKWIDNQNRLTPLQADVEESQRKQVAEHWITGQKNYFADSSNKIAFHHKRNQKLSRVAWWLVLLAMATYIASIGLDLILGAQVGRDAALAVTAWSMYVYWAFLSAAALVSAYSTIKAHAENEVDYTHSVIKFRVAHAAIDKADPEEAKRVVEHLGNAALRETASWLRRHRARPLRLLF